MGLQKDMSRVAWTPEELENIERAADIVVAVEAETGPGDEDPGFDLDDAGNVVIKQGSKAYAVFQYVMAGRTTRERFDRLKEIASGTERALGVIEGAPPQPGIGRTSN